MLSADTGVPTAVIIAACSPTSEYKAACTMYSSNMLASGSETSAMVAVAAAYTLFTLSAAQTDHYKKV
eukprot:13525-Heterococcus_DN1.PRE.1